MNRAVSRLLSDRQFALIGTVMAAAVLAHAPHLPPAILAFVGATVAVAWLLRRRGLVLPGWTKLVLIAVFALILIAQYRNPLGREPGSALACAMLALKLLETRTRRDALAAICFASFTLMSALLFDTSLLFTLATFAGVALLLAALRELQPDSADAASHRRPTWRAYWPSLRASLISLALSAPLALCGFLFIPRLDSPLWRTPADSSGRTGISDTMTPGSVQDLLLDDSAAFRVSFDGLLPARTQLYWRGPVLTDFDGTTWRRRDIGLSMPPANTADANASTVSYEVTLEASDKPWLFALDLPVDIPAETLRSRDMSLMRRRPITDLYRYRARSSPGFRLDPSLPADLRRAALALPDHFNPRSVEQGRAWRHDLGDDDSIVRVALELFHNAFFYTLSPPPLGRDSVDDFLFSTRRGYCEQYASAFVVLMRSAGIPARVVTGYQGGYFNAVGRYLLVRQSDAHAWAEVWQAGRGWVRIDPTAAVSPQRVELGAQAAGSEERAWYRGRWLLTLRNQFDLINRGWNSLVVQFNAQRQLSLLHSFGIDRVEPATLLWLLVATGGILLTAATLWAMRTTRKRTAPLDVAYDALCAKLACVTAQRAANEGPHAYAARLRAEAMPSVRGAGEAQSLIADYVSLRYACAFPSVQDIARFVRDVRRLRLTTRD